MRDFHRWGGLFFGWVLFIVFFTGTLAVFAPEITYWMTPEARYKNVTHAQALRAAQKALETYAPDADTWFVILPQGRTKSLEISWQKNGEKFERFVHAETGELLAVRQTEGGEFFSEFHYRLHHDPWGIWLVSIAGVMMIWAVISGIVIRKNVIRDFFCLRWKKTLLSVHMMAGVLTLPFVLLITYTGIVMTFSEVMPVTMHTFYKNEGKFWADFLQIPDVPENKAPASLYPLAELLPLAEQELGAGQMAFVQIRHPQTAQAVIHFMRRVDDRVMAITDRASFDGVSGKWLATKNTWDKNAVIVRSIVGLHIAKFGGYPLAWLYFFFGLAGSLMIASGLIFFTNKRRLQKQMQGAAGRDVYRVAESMNIAVICGCMSASAAYFGGNRLLPAGLRGREEGEIAIFFLTWGLLVVHAFWRNQKTAWTEQISICAALCFFLPWLNVWKTGEQFWQLAGQGNWMSAGIDVFFLTTGLVLGAMALRLYKKAGSAYKSEPLLK